MIPDPRPCPHSCGWEQPDDTTWHDGGEVRIGRAVRLAVRRTWTILRGGHLHRQEETSRALATAVCRWHHAHYNQPIPCVQAKKEADAITGLLFAAGFVIATEEASV